ncbi:16S rRNA (adenine(1518)-N(6)/adenine(1519)-N(6))-dimethyltransferase RsmA [Marinimicrobium alkaliphilum]|uniref:16S rRNA (adenine(1518)-N(6)/adenine(1519)-N(6))- dimethyltransferase RsmA n=1 Tax=Marinimicrobium alkaliphilum TaxID=2202654 RepID=UPI000DB9C9E0|nr:16S rRNA (adenine(1518)-N(6)/adenine(1519)-N(6))-dimethyltransferase RsmA [Marinimicrobium alkaliphilum]
MSKAQTPLGGHRARKRFGQNFLVDQNIVQRIVDAIHPGENDRIVEIGPGKGAITGLLAERCNHLRVIELDRDLVPWLRVRFEKHPDFELFQTDALRFDFSQLTSPGQPLRIVGNLPYNISTPLIFHLLSFAGQVHDMHFMLQKEVVKRMAAAPGEKAFGRLTVMVQYYCQVDWLFEVPPGAFDPAPKVDSAIVRLRPYTTPPLEARDPKLLARLVNVAFQQRRKTLRNALKQLLPTERIDTLPVDTGVRPENLSVADYVTISNLIDPEELL